MNYKDLEGSGRGLIQVLPRHMPKGTEENYENFRHDSRCPGRDSNRAPLKYENTPLPLCQSVGSSVSAYKTSQCHNPQDHNAYFYIVQDEAAYYKDSVVCFLTC
jgi:hypothetical protein